MKKLVSFSCTTLLMGALLLYLLYSIGGKPLITSLNLSQWTILFLTIVLSSFIITVGYLRFVCRFKWKENITLRFGLTLLLLWGTTMATVYVIALNPEIWNASTGLSVSEYRSSFLLKGAIVGLVLSLFITWGDFSWSFYNHYSHETLAQLLSARKQKELQFQMLRSQLTPHFLFNSLNTASFLMGTRPQQAEEFLRKLAFNFNHLLLYAKSPLNSLEKELEIVDNYFRLMEIRFGPKILLEKKIEITSLHRKLPALSLQLLVENALKHNVATTKRPMVIQICADTEQVIVINNQTSTPDNVSSHGFGLKSLQAHYNYFSEKQMQVSKTDSHYQVILPYIKNLKLKSHA